MSPDQIITPRTVADLGRLAREARLAGQPFALLPLAQPDAALASGEMRAHLSEQVQISQSAPAAPLAQCDFRAVQAPSAHH